MVRIVIITSLRALRTILGSPIPLCNPNVFHYPNIKPYHDGFSLVCVWVAMAYGAVVVLFTVC